MADFNKSYELLQEWENRKTAGGWIVYSNHTADSGGETVFGVARVKNPHLAMWREVDLIKQQLDKEYKAEGKNYSVGSREYALKISQELMKRQSIRSECRNFYYAEYWLKMKCDIVANDDFATNLFLLGVNAGTKRAIRVGQEACGIIADGIIGKNTMQAWRLAEKPQVLKFTSIEIDYYHSLAKKNPKNKVFLEGWLNRARAI